MKIRKRSDGYWLLDCGLDGQGKRVRLTFKTEDAAIEERSIRLGEKQRLGESASLLSHEERIEFLRAKARLADVGVTIDQAVEFYLSHGQVKRPKVFEELAAACYVSKVRQGLDSDTTNQLKAAFRGACRGGFGNVDYFNLLIQEVDGVKKPGSRALEDAKEASPQIMSDSVTAQDVSRMLMDESRGWSAKTQRGYKTGLSTLYAWAIEHGHATMNPVTKAKIKAPDFEKEVEFFRVEECRQLLLRAWSEDPALLPWVVMKLFTGARNEEIPGLTPDNLDLERAEVSIMGAKRRSRRRRAFSIEPNAVAWLELCRDLGALVGPDCFNPSNFRKRWEAIRPDPWIRNGLRHTFPSMHYAMFRNESELQTIMAHRSAKLLHDTYRGVVKVNEAEEFWSIMPG